jgi:hypothetical protein
MIRKMNLLLLAILSGIAIQCGPIETSQGPGTETIGVTACVTYPSGLPAGNAKVFVRPVDYLADTSGYGAAPMPDAVTDSLGYFSADGFSSGEYRIEVRDTALSAILIPCTLENANDSIVDIGKQTLLPAGALYSVLKSTGSISYIRIRGMERVVRAKDSLEYTIHQLPAGDMPFHFTSVLPDTVVTNEAPVAIVQGKKDSLSYILQPSDGVVRDYDTLKSTVMQIHTVPTWSGGFTARCLTADQLTWRSYGFGMGSIDSMACHVVNIHDYSSGIINFGITACDTLRCISAGTSQLTFDTIRTHHLSLRLQGSSRFKINKLSSDSIHIRDDGVGLNRTDSCFVDAARIVHNGSSEYILTGRARKTEFIGSGTGTFDARGFRCDSVNVRLLNSGIVYVHAVTYLETNNTGTGTIYYTGTPVVKNVGPGVVKQTN